MKTLLKAMRGELTENEGWELLAYFAIAWFCLLFVCFLAGTAALLLTMPRN